MRDGWLQNTERNKRRVNRTWTKWKWPIDALEIRDLHHVTQSVKCEISWDRVIAVTKRDLWRKLQAISHMKYEEGTVTSSMLQLAVLAWNSSWNLRFKCHGDKRSSRRLAALDKWTAHRSNSWDAARNQSSCRHAAKMESCMLPELSELTTAALSQYTRRR